MQSRDRVLIYVLSSAQVAQAVLVSLHNRVTLGLFSISIYTPWVSSNTNCMQVRCRSDQCTLPHTLPFPMVWKFQLRWAKVSNSGCRMGRYPDLQTIYLSFSSHGQRLFPVSSAAPLTFSPFPLPRHSLPMSHICPFGHTPSSCSHPQPILPLPISPQNISQGGAPAPILPLCVCHV